MRSEARNASQAFDAVMKRMKKDPLDLSEVMKVAHCIIEAWHLMVPEDVPPPPKFKRPNQ